MSTIPTQVRLPQHLYDVLSEISEQMKIPMSDVIRYAIGLGVKDLSLIDFDVDTVLETAVKTARDKLKKLNR